MSQRDLENLSSSNCIYLVPKHFHHPEGNTIPIKQFFLSPPVTATTNLLSVFMDLTILDI